MTPSRQAGFSLVQLTIVLAVAGFIVSGLLSQQRQQQQIDEYARIHYIADLLGKALDSYYLAHCDESPFPQPDVAALVAESHLMNDRSLLTPLADEFGVSVLNPGTVSVSMQVSAIVDATALATRIAANADNASSVGLQITWLYKPTIAGTEDLTGLQDLKGAFGDTRC